MQAYDGNAVHAVQPGARQYAEPLTVVALLLRWFILVVDQLWPLRQMSGHCFIAIMDADRAPGPSTEHTIPIVAAAATAVDWSLPQQQHYVGLQGTPVTPA